MTIGLLSYTLRIKECCVHLRVIAGAVQRTCLDGVGIADRDELQPSAHFNYSGIASAYIGGAMP